MTKQTFSQRMGLEPLKREFQLDSMDDRLRNGLWNCLIKFREIMDEYDESKVDKFEVKVYEVELVSDKFKNLAWENFFGRRIDELTYDSTFPATFQKDLFNLVWNKVYEFFEFLFSIQPGLSICGFNS